MEAHGLPVSTYDVRAPFDGTILEREQVVPGIVVDGSHHIFTMANLSEVWIEAHVHESDFDLLERSAGGLVEFTSPAYPERTFEGRVLYTGDLVDEKSRTVRLLATARNAYGRLKPGMFVNVQIHAPDALKLPEIPETALLTDGRIHYVYVQVAPEEFARHDVKIGNRENGHVAIQSGLKPGERVVVRGAFGLKAKAEAQQVGQLPDPEPSGDGR